MYKVFDGKSWLEFSSYTYLVNWISKYNKTFGSQPYNSFLDHTGNNPNDVYFGGYAWLERIELGYCPRVNRVLNEDGHSIYSEKLIQDVMNHTYDFETQQMWFKEVSDKRKVAYYKRHCFRIPDSAYPGFRSGPWPFIHQSTRYSCYRSIKTTNEKRFCADREQREFNRGSRGVNLPGAWDEHCRDWQNDGWKHQGKNRHQWEKGFKTKVKHEFGKGVYTVRFKGRGIPDVFDEEDFGLEDNWTEEDFGIEDNWTEETPA